MKILTRIVSHWTPVRCARAPARITTVAVAGSMLAAALAVAPAAAGAKPPDARGNSDRARTLWHVRNERGAGNRFNGRAGVRIGVIGDSLSDEYSAPMAGPLLGLEGYEWGTVLTRLRKVSLGGFDDGLTRFGQPVGFEYNHALKGQAVARLLVPVPGVGLVPFNNTFDLIGATSGLGSSGQSFPEQAAALALNFAHDEIDVGVLQGGANDIFMYRAVSERIPELGWNFDPQNEHFQALKARIVNGFAAVLDTEVPWRATLAHENVILSLVPFFGDPLLQAAIADINFAPDGLAAMAFAKGVPVFDSQASVVARIDASDPAAPVVVVGKLRIPFLGNASSDELVPRGDPASVDDAQCGFRSNPPFVPGCPTQAYQLHLVQDDGVHPTTISQALLANDILMAINEHFGFKVKLLRDKEIIRLALGGKPRDDD